MQSVTQKRTTFKTLPIYGLLFAAAILFPVWAAAQEKPAPAWDTTQARGKTRDIDFDTSEGTWMSLDTSPDGKWIVFDLLGHIYRMPFTGGKAECLTQDSGVALNTTPRFSPDGKTIAFISDRKGQNNLWLMDADGKNPRAVFTDKTQRALSPVWTPDGNYIIVQRQGTRPEGGPEFGWNLFMYHKYGGSGIKLVGSDKGPGWHSVSRDGKYLYFDVQICSPLPFG
ncbi:MAG: hypothetical protein WBR10_06895, partial [Candidatus Acidiferrum sp.]